MSELGDKVRTCTRCGKAVAFAWGEGECDLCYEIGLEEARKFQELHRKELLEPPRRKVVYVDVSDLSHDEAVALARKARELFNQANPTVESKLAALVADCKEKMDAQREALAGYAHEAWAGWMRCQAAVQLQMERKGKTVITWTAAEDYDRWQRQMRTPYADLPEAEKASDRAQADRILAIMRGEG